MNSTTPAVHVDDVHHHFGSTHALRGVDLTLEPNRIIGMLGRNGAGKSTLMSILAGHRRPTSGSVRMGGRPVYESTAMREVFLLGDASGDGDGTRLRHRARLVATLRPHFATDVFDALLDEFDLDPRTRISRFSRGQRSAAGVSLAIASRCPITILDEAHLGMDAPSRHALWDHLLADLERVPRTILVSTHHLEEVAPLLQDVVILDRGRVVHDGDVGAITAAAATVTGPASTVAEVTAGCRVVADRRAGGARTTTVVDIDPMALRAAASGRGVLVEPVGLQDFYVHVTTQDQGVTTHRETTTQGASS